MRHPVLIAMLAAAGSIAATAAAAVQIGDCAPWPDLSHQLHDLFGEAPIGGGMVDDSLVVQVLALPGGETWTMVAIDATGLACVIGEGTDWEVRLPGGPT